MPMLFIRMIFSVRNDMEEEDVEEESRKKKVDSIARYKHAKKDISVLTSLPTSGCKKVQNV